MELKAMERLRAAIRDVLGEAERAVCFFQRQQYYPGCNCSARLMEYITVCMELLLPALPEINGQEPLADAEGMLVMLRELEEAQETRDYVLLADLYSLKLIPVFTEMQERIVSALGVFLDEELLCQNIRRCVESDPRLAASLFAEPVLREAAVRDRFSDEVLDGITGRVEDILQKGYAVENTSSGFLTLALCRDGHSFYFHTNGQVTREAVQQAQEWLAQEKEEYTFYGLGFGYPYLEMLREDRNITIRVVEMNRDLLFLAMVFAPVWQLYESGRFSLVYDPTGRRLEKMDLGVNETKGFYIFYPALHGISKGQLRAKLEAYFVEESSVRTRKRLLEGNFRKNSRGGYRGSLDDVRESFRGKDVVIVAAGPSLDKNMDRLRARGDNTVILAVGTVLRKLLSADIRPDFVVMIDASGELMPRQIRGVEQCGVPLLFLSTVCSRVVRDYGGEKYILCQQGFAPAEELAKANGWETVETGGSVVTTAFDCCLRMGPRRIIFAGLDLAYTGGADHASDTPIAREVKHTAGIWVEGIDGKKIPTAKNLKIYKEWLERRLANRSEDEKRITVIDATEGGAKLRGMKVMTLQEAMALRGKTDGGKKTC